MDPEFDDGFKDILKVWCNQCRRYISPYKEHVCQPPGETEEAQRQLENWLGDYEKT